MSLAETIAITIGHEIEGHALQHNNKKRIPLQLFKKVGGNRSVIFAEGGAMNNENKITEQAFGYSSLTDADYIRAMQKRMEGGSYPECVKAFYDCTIEPYKLQYEKGLISEPDYKNMCESTLKRAVNRTKRIFRGSTAGSEESSFITNSKNTVYLEQVQLFRALEAHGLEKYLYLTGANLDDLLFLMKAGLFDPNKIDEPKFHALKIWDRVKDQYQLEETKL